MYIIYIKYKIAHATNCANFYIEDYTELLYKIYYFDE